MFYNFSFKQILDFVGQLKGWQYVERVSKDIAENIMMNVSEEELYNLPTAEYVNRRGGFVFKQHTVYHVALQACAELRSKEVIFFLCITIFHHHNILVTAHRPCTISISITLYFCNFFYH